MQTHVALVKYAPTLDQQMNSSSLQTAACENIFQTERENIYLDLQKKKRKQTPVTALLCYPLTRLRQYIFKKAAVELAHSAGWSVSL